MLGVYARQILSAENLKMVEIVDFEKIVLKKHYEMLQFIANCFHPPQLIDGVYKLSVF